MKKYIIYTKPFPGSKYECYSIIEVEGKIVTPLEDPSVIFLPKEEFKFNIVKPDWLLDKPSNSKDKSTSLVYYSHSIYWTLYQAKQAAEKMIIQNFEFNQRKYGTHFPAEDIEFKCSQIKEILL